MLKRFKCHLIRLRSTRSACCADQHCKCKSNDTWASNERNMHRVTEMQVFFDAGWRPTRQVVVAVLAKGGQHGKLVLQCCHGGQHRKLGSVGAWRPTWQVGVAVLAHWRSTTQVVVAVLAHGGQDGKLVLQCWHTTPVKKNLRPQEARTPPNTASLQPLC